MYTIKNDILELVNSSYNVNNCELSEYGRNYRIYLDKISRVKFNLENNTSNYIPFKNEYFINEEISNYRIVNNDSDQIKIENTLRHIILCIQLNRLLKHIYNLDDICEIDDNLVGAKDFVTTNSSRFSRFLMDIFKNSNLINQIDQYKEIGDFLTHDGRDFMAEKIHNIKISNIDFLLYNLKSIDTCCLYNISFTDDFELNMRRRYDNIDQFGYKGVWFTPEKAFLKQYMCLSLGKITNLATYTPIIRSFILKKEKKEINNLLILSNNCQNNIKVLDAVCKCLNIYIDTYSTYHKFRNFYKSQTLHPNFNYYLVYMLNYINSLNPNKKINGWINIEDSSEIFIQDPEEYLTQIKEEKINFVKYVDQDTQQIISIDYNKTDSIIKKCSDGNISKANTHLYDEIDNEIICDETTNKTNIIYKNIQKICDTYINLFDFF